MPQKKRALGRGLEALLPQKPAPKPSSPASDAIASEPKASPTAVTLPVSQIFRNEDQPRLTFDPVAMEELVDSIRRHGIIQPVAVMPATADKYTIVAGERRWRAAQEAGLTDIPVIVLKKLSKGDLMQFALVENLQREDLRPMEEARAYQSLQKNFDLTAEEIADRVGKSRSAIANSLRLLNLRSDMQEDVELGRITAGHARAILSLDQMRDQIRLRDMILHNSMSVRQAENKARELIEAGASRTGKAKNSASSRKDEPENVRRIREQLVDTLACRVAISTKGENRGRVEIYYDSLDDLQNLLDALGIQV